jgi:signal-transduction protein with cAMP-binding, CBS, and nucleotidyltransferase domain
VLAAHGTPPVPFTLLVMGSAGRGESLLGPDQDNGFILADYPDAEHAAVDAWFRPVAEAFNAGLAAAGFPLCPGGIMARNPLWRKTLPQWRRQFETWATRRVGAALLFSDIAFDFRAAAGDPAPAAALREHLGRVLARSPALLVAMAGQNQGLTVGLTLWGGFTDDEPGEGTRTDLKLHGLMPLVAAARLMALRDGVAATGTPDRLAALAAQGTLSAREAATLTDAFDLLLDTVLRQQLADHAAGATAGNLVDTAALPKPARGALRDALKAVRSFSRGSFGSFTGQLW